MPNTHSTHERREHEAHVQLGDRLGLAGGLHPRVEEQRPERADGSEHVEQTEDLVRRGDGKDGEHARTIPVEKHSPVASTPMSRSYIVRTYGCQMNEHDSERIAGLLEADGLVRAESETDADVVVLNTCCIRENADNKLYGNLGHLKTWKGKKDGRQIVVSGCLAQKDQDLVATKAGHVDVVMGTHNVHRAAELLRESEHHEGPLTEILQEAVIDDHAMFPSALPGPSRDVVQRVGDDPDRLRQQLRVLHRPRRPRCRDEPPVRAGRRRGRAARRARASPR